MFLHLENKQLLWHTLQKSPYLVEFTQKFSEYREDWFSDIVATFYKQFILHDNNFPKNAKELLEMNKLAIKFMVEDLKRLLGYSLTSQYQTSNIVNSYNVAEERKRREDVLSANYNKYQTEYNKLLERPVLPITELPSESVDEKIKNMDELLKEHSRMRNIDLTIHSTSQEMVNNVIYSKSSSNTSKLKIMDEISNIDSECVISLPIETNNDDTQLKKRVHWGEQLNNNSKNNENDIEYAV